MVFAGESLRFWAVAHIGSRSRTRSDSVGALVESGPFGRSRNPLYIGNALILIGVGLWGGWHWSVAWLLFVVVQYSAIVRWEESVLAQEHGDAFRAYCSRVPRWWPSGRPVPSSAVDGLGALRSERATITAILVVISVFWGPTFFA